MEIDEKNLFTPEEAKLLTELMNTVINKQNEIMEMKLKHFKESLKADPKFAFVQLMCDIGDVNADEQIDRFVATKRVEFQKRANLIVTTAKVITQKVPNLTTK